MVSSKQNLDKEIVSVLMKISNTSLSIAKNLEKLNTMKGEKDDRNKRIIINRRRIKAV